MDRKDATESAISEVAPSLPSQLVYWPLTAGVLLPVVVSIVVWKRMGHSQLSMSVLFWTLLGTYPFMLIGCLAGEFLARKFNAGFYAAIGDNPGQTINLFTGWFWANSYLVVLIALFFAFRHLAS